jgi:predicted alpha/beta-hydrolase family hydrolase
MQGERLIDGSDVAGVKLILAHGAGQGMASPFMHRIAQLLAGDNLQVIRFNFPYMQAQERSGKKRPPDREAKLLEYWREQVRQCRTESSHRLFIGGKSMGGRMASLLADELQVDGLICLGYPFHPPGKPERLRTQHLIELQTPTLICQGERDSFGRQDEVSGYSLSPRILFHWLSDGDHSFKPRKSSGLSLEQNLQSAAKAILHFIGESS